MVIMSEVEVIPELKQIIGALLFANRQPMTAADIRKVLKDTAKNQEGPMADFAAVKEADIVAAVAELDASLTRQGTGLHIAEVANGYRLQNDAACGIWLRTLLDKGKANRLSKPALETLAIIAYRQPCTRSEIESVRGVAVDQIVKNLVEMQLVKVVGRSELPGRPWLFATTQKFLEYFGLKSVDELPGVEELRRRDQAQAASDQAQAAPDPSAGPAAPVEDEPDLFAEEDPAASEEEAADRDGEEDLLQEAPDDADDEDADQSGDVDGEEEDDEDEVFDDDDDDEEFDDDEDEDDDEEDR